MSRRQEAEKFRIGMVVAHRTFPTISGQFVQVPDPEQFIHLQFRRFAGCPICNLHLRAMVRRRDEIAAAKIREIVVFHSTAEELLNYSADLPFCVVADPSKRLYMEFGVESAPRALLSPYAWSPVFRAIIYGVWTVVFRGKSAPPVNPLGGRLGLPADFLIASDGHLLACKYGDHADDQWSVDELLSLAAQVRLKA
jgi:hypothetical protein